MKAFSITIPALFTLFIASLAQAGVIQYPVADANGPYYLEYGTDLQLDGTGSYSDQEAYIISYEWDVTGDSVFDNMGPAPIVDWSIFETMAVGDYRDIWLRVTDNFGQLDIGGTTVTIGPTSIPEPSTLLLLGGGLAGLAFAVRRRRKE